MSLGLTSVTITWATLPGDVADAITKILITYRKSRDTGNVSSCDVDPRQSDVNLVGLTSATAYVTKFVIILVDGSTITTRPLHFVTMAEGEFHCSAQSLSCKRLGSPFQMWPGFNMR